MNVAIILSGFALGLASGGHCVLMCGAGSAWCFGSQSGSNSTPVNLMAFHCARLISYALAGALLASAANVFHTLTVSVVALRPLWTMANAALFLIGTVLLVTARQPLIFATLGKGINTFIHRKENLRNKRLSAEGRSTEKPIVMYTSSVEQTPPPVSWYRSFTLGMAWAVVPCASLYAAWTLALFAGDPLSGALTTASFALASGLQLAVAQYLFMRTKANSTKVKTEAWNRMGMRVAGAALCISAGLSITALLTGHGTDGLFCF